MRPFGHQQPQRKVRPASRRAWTVDAPLHAVTRAAFRPTGAAQPRADPRPALLRARGRTSPQSPTPERQAPGYKFPARMRGHLPAAPSWAEGNCRWPAPRRSADRSAGARPPRGEQPRRGETAPTSPEPDREPLQPHSFPSQRFRGLFDSLFKVLFTFPSRYLFAIGLVPVFSFRWSLPPTLGCIPEQPDSPKTVAARPGGVAHGALTLSDVPFQANFDSASPGTAASPGHNSPTPGAGDFRLELFPLRSPLLGESWLVSFPPLIDMLKFSG